MPYSECITYLFDRYHRGNQKLGMDGTIFRNPIPQGSTFLLNRFRRTLQWSFFRPDKVSVSMDFGQVLSWLKLANDLSFKRKLLDELSNAIGGEMEGSGLYAATSRNKTEDLSKKSL